MQYWAAVQTKPKAEPDVRRDIEDLGVGAYHPTYSQLSGGRWSRRSLLPRYVFALLTPADNWAEINHIDGVSGVLTNDNRPQKISQAEIDRLMLAQIQGQYDVVQQRAGNGTFLPAQKKKKRRRRQSKRARAPRQDIVRSRAA